MKNIKKFGKNKAVIDKIEWKPSDDFNPTFRLNINKDDAKSLVFYVIGNDGSKYRYTYQGSFKITKK